MDGADLRRWWRRAGRTLWRRGAERDLAREIASHRQLAHDEFRRRGLSEDDARAAAHRAVGRADVIGEHQREARMFRVFDDLGRDVRYAVRMIRRAPGVSAIAVASLALGIGANTVAFSLVDGLIAHVLPVPHPDELVNITELWPDSPRRTDAPTWEFTGLRDGLAGTLTVAAVSVLDRSNLTFSTPAGARIDGGRARAGIVSGNYFPMTQVPAAIGRTLGPDDDRTPGGHRVVVLSDAYWASHLHRSADVLTDTLTISDTPFAIVGVMPRGFDGEWIGRPVDFWVTTMMQGTITPEAPNTLTASNAYWLRLLGRLAPGVTRAQAEAAVQPVYQRVVRDARGPAASASDLAEIARQRIELVPGAHGYSPQVEARTPLISILSIVSALVLLVVCANVAGLLLSRADARRREFAVRLAIGADARRLGRQLLAESVLLAALGGIAGLAVGVWGTRILAGLMTSGPVKVFWAQTSWFTFDITLSWRGLLFTAGISLAAGCLFALAPLIQARRVSLAPVLSARTAADQARSRFGVSHGLVVLQVALALVVIVAATLLVRTLVGLQSRDLGFDRRNLLLVWTQPTSTGRQGQQMVALWRDVQAQLMAVPGVVSASAGNTAVLGGNVASAGPPQQPMQVDGQAARTTTAPGVRRFIQPNFFKTLGVRMLRGREFTDRDVTGLAPPVVIINEAFARLYFGDDDPIGRHVRLGATAGTPVEIVGVAREYETGSPRGGAVTPMVSYLPYTSTFAVPNLVVMCIAVRTAADPHGFETPIRDALRRVDSSLTVVKMDTVDEQLDDVLVQARLLARLTGFFGGVAGLLACLGLYGLVAHMTARRTAEIGVRMALGATSSRVLATTLGDGARLAVVGILIGVPAAVATSRTLRSQLFGVGPYDPGTIAISVTLMIAIALAAAWLPARRASRIDPMNALREE
jgi:predicted permease